MCTLERDSSDIPIYSVYDFRGGYSTILIENAFEQIDRMRPIKVTCVRPVAEFEELKKIHFWPDIDSITGKRASMSDQSFLRFSRYTHGFCLNAAFGIEFRSPVTKEGWR